MNSKPSWPRQAWLWIPRVGADIRPDVSLWEQFNRAYVKRFTKDLPARGFIGSGPLLKGARFEMMGMAIRR